MSCRPLPLLAAILLLTACGQESDTPELPRFQDRELVQGRNTWMQVCRNCHLLGVAGAPAVTDHEAWQRRFRKGRETLYQSAVNGIRVDGKWTMPPRGGEARLSDAQVHRAVDYMLAAALHPQATSSER